MHYFIVFLFELALLAILSRYSSSYFLRLFHSVTGSEKLAVILFSILFFPGTLIHELAHWVMAKILLVPASGMEFLPKLEGDSIKLGSVSIAKTDPLRRLLIGVAPVIVGLTILLGLLWSIQNYFTYFSLYPWWIWLGMGYVVFVIGSTMFSSRKDLEGSLGVIISIGLTILGIYLLDFGWVLNALYLWLTINLNDFFYQISGLLTVPIGIDLAVIIVGLLSRQRLEAD
jgi:hypothetical protein